MKQILEICWYCIISTLDTITAITFLSTLWRQALNILISSRNIHPNDNIREYPAYWFRVSTRNRRRSSALPALLNLMQNREWHRKTNIVIVKVLILCLAWHFYKTYSYLLLVQLRETHLREFHPQKSEYETLEVNTKWSYIYTANYCLETQKWRSGIHWDIQW